MMGWRAGWLASRAHNWQTCDGACAHDNMNEH